MSTRGKEISLQVSLSITVGLLAYIWLVNSSQPGKVSDIVELLLFGSIGFIGIAAFIKTTYGKGSALGKFQLFFGLTYLVVSMSYAISLSYLFQNPGVMDISINETANNVWLKLAAVFKLLSFVFLLFTWYYLYKALNLRLGKVKKWLLFTGGYLLYFIPSLVITLYTGDGNVLVLGILLGFAVAQITLIAQSQSTQYLIVIFGAFAFIHLWESYIVATKGDLATGINNFAYWAVIVMYGFEMSQWLKGKYIESTDREVSKN